MPVLQRKLLRELVRHKVQIVSIALVMACGTMTIIGLRSTLASVRRARDDYFVSHRFADVFAHAPRVPVAVAHRLGALPGVATVETRIARDIRLDVPGLDAPAMGHMVSLPRGRRPRLNDLHLASGRWIDAHRPDEVLVSDRFAELNALGPGDSLAAVINGRWQRLHIVGVALAPDFVVEYAGSALIADNRRYGVLWANEAMLASAFDMDGAFNEVAARLAPGAREADVLAAIDRVLLPWGSPGAYGRRDHLAARILEDEFAQLRVNATVFPIFFLIVAAYLLNVVLSRLVASQRDEIAALKAFGFTRAEIGVHYLSFALVAVLLGGVLGISLGAWMSSGFTSLYTDYFRFPTMPARIDWSAAAMGVGVNGGFALLGALGAVRRVMRLTPADALRGESPTRFRPLFLEWLGFGHLVTPSWRMVLRNLERRPFRTASTVIGVGLAIALLVAGRFPYDAFDRLVDIEFREAQRYDLAVGFTQRRETRALREVARIPGVVDVEPLRSTPVRVSTGSTAITTTITGIDARARLRRLVDKTGAWHDVPSGGVVVNRTLANRLKVGIGDSVTVHLVDRDSRARRLAVVAVFEAMLDQGLYMESRFFEAVVGAHDVVGVYVRLAHGMEPDVVTRLEDMAGVAGVSSRGAFMRTMDEQLRQSMTFVLTTIIVSACVIAIGVVYNSARIGLAERARELGSLRVLGFTSGEIARMLLAEEVIVVALAIPVGLALGFGFSRLLATAFASDRLQFPFVISARSQLLAIGVVVGSAAAASLVVYRRIRRLNMVTVLRTRE